MTLSRLFSHSKSRILTLVALAVLAALAADVGRTPVLAAPPPVKSPPEAADPALNWSRLDAVLERALSAGEFPGVVVEVGQNGKTLYRKAFGYRSLTRREKMTPDTIFDCASLTKVVATAPSVMQLLEQGRFRLNDAAAMYLPGFGVSGKADITIRELLTHYSGLPPDLSQRPAWDGYETGIEKAYATVPTYPPGSHFEYSDINYIVLAELVHRLSQERIDEYALDHLWKPLGMNHTRFLPPASWRNEIAATRLGENGSWIRGTVNDPTAASMGGVAGNAGMFSTADDLARFANMLLNGGEGENGARVLTPMSVEKMTTPQTPFNVPEVRGLGWDLDSAFSSNRGELLPLGSYGHTGYTGTSMWMEPSSKTFIIVLAGATRPSSPPILALRSEVATVVAAILSTKDDAAQWAALESGNERITGYNEVGATLHRPISRNGEVETGLDVMVANGFESLRGKRVGLITNPTGIDREGRRDLDDMLAAGINVTAGFSPEHGWAGNLDGPAGDSRDAKTGIPVFSAYGEAVPGSPEAGRTLPEAGLSRVDVLVYDLQDVGVRFYTYETTLGFTLETAARHHLPLVVLDRPNPIDGIDVQGPPLDQADKSFVGYYPGMPVRNGMTVGELAEMFNDTDHIGADLRVVRMQGWTRGDYFDETGLPWVNPSPNLRDLNQAVLYPGVALVEGTNVSVGRGTDTPFELLGAPWIQETQLAAYLNARRLPGVRFMPIRFTPTSDRYAHEACNGVNIIVTNRDLLDAPEMGLEIASALATLYPNDWVSTDMHLLAGSQGIVQEILAGEDPRRIAGGYDDAVKDFEDLRQNYLLYR